MTLHESKASTRYSAAEWQMRTDLAACYRLADLFGFSEIIWNHITAKVPDTEHFLINRFVRLYSVDTGDVELEIPGGFTTFNDFFIRELRAGARPIDADDRVLVSPVDASTLSILWL